MYDLIIIGGGPAGVSAGIYAARKRLKTLLIAESFGGQSAPSSQIQNWIGIKSISGSEFAKNLEEHLRAQDSIEIKSSAKAEKILKKDHNFEVHTINMLNTECLTYLGRALIIATGARRRKLGVPGEEEFKGRGVSFCATCDGPLFTGKKIAVIGAGNAGLGTALELLAYASRIYVLEYQEYSSADAVIQEKVQAEKKIEILYKTEAQEIIGNTFIKAIKYKDRTSGQYKVLDIDGVFIEVGTIPNSEIAKNLVEINNKNEIVIDHATCRTSQEGIFAAGDVTDVPYKQNIIAAGEGAKAALSAYQYIKH